MQVILEFPPILLKLGITGSAGKTSLKELLGQSLTKFIKQPIHAAIL